MKHYCWLMILCALTWAGCTDTIDTGTVQEKGTIYVNITTGPLDKSRTALTSSANLHHVQKVYAVLYKGTGESATFVSCQDLGWNPKDEPSYSEDVSQSKQFSLQSSQSNPDGDYTILCIGLDDKSGNTYNLPDAIRNKTLSEAKAILADGRTKTDIATSELFAGWATFTYEQDKPCEVTVEMRRRVAGVICYLKDIPYKLSETVGGTTNTYRITRVQLELHTNQTTATSLIRRNPETTGTFPPEFIYSGLNDSKILWSQSLLEEGFKQSTEDPTIYDIPTTGNILPNTLFGAAYLLPIANSAATADEIKNNPTLKVCLYGRLFDEESNSMSGSEALIKTFPAVYEEATADKDRKAYNIRANYIYHVGLKPNNDNTEEDQPVSLMGTELRLRVLKWNEEVIPVDFPEVPIYATMEFENGRTEDYIYDCIGSDYRENVTLVDKKPVGTPQLTREKLSIHPSLLNNPWKLTIVDSLKTDKPGLYYYEPSTGKYMTTTGMVTAAHPSLHKDQVNTVELLLTDYTVRRTYNADGTYNKLVYETNGTITEENTHKTIDQDYRIIYIILETFSENEDGTVNEVTPLRADTFRLRQYNAITVQTENKDGSGPYRAFSRFNMETNRNNSGAIEAFNPPKKEDYSEGDRRNDDKPYTPKYNDGYGVRMGYGYWGTSEIYITDDYLAGTTARDINYNGEYTYRKAKKLVGGGDEDKRYWKFSCSAIYASQRMRLEVSGNKADGFTIEKRSDDNKTYWYLPACYELIPFLQLSDKLTTERMRLHVTLVHNDDNMYWSCQPNNVDNDEAWSSYVDQDGFVWGLDEYDKDDYKDNWKEKGKPVWEAKSRDRLFYIRQACHIHE